MSPETVQMEINKNVRAELLDLHKHADVANHEMGVIKVDVAVIKEDIKVLKLVAEKVDTRTWLILATLIIGILIEIVFTVAKIKP